MVGGAPPTRGRGGSTLKVRDRGARTRLEFVVGTANTAHNMGKAWRRVISASGKVQ
jgi:hypothetical protein